MKLLRLAGTLGFFQVVGFFIAVILVIPTAYLVDHLRISIAFIAIPSLITIGVAIFISKRYYKWLKNEPEKRQLIFHSGFTLTLVVTAILEYLYG